MWALAQSGRRPQCGERWYACLSLDLKAGPWGAFTLMPESLWPRHLDSSFGPLVSDPFFFAVFSAAGCLPCQFKRRGARTEGIDNPLEG